MMKPDNLANLKTNKRRATGSALMLLVTGLIFSGALAAQPSNTKIDITNDIRVNVVKNTCRTYQRSFINIYDLEMPSGLGSPGTLNKRAMYLGVASPKDSAQLRRFIKDAGTRLASISDRRRALDFLGDNRRFVQPCYNAVAGQYDRKQNRSNVERSRNGRQESRSYSQNAPQRNASTPPTQNSVRGDAKQTRKNHQDQGGSVNTIQSRR